MISHLENHTITSDDNKIADILNVYFFSVTKSLNVNYEKNESCNGVSTTDLVLKIHEEYKSHLSIIKITVLMPNNRCSFTFPKITWQEIKTGISPQLRLPIIKLTYKNFES